MKINKKTLQFVDCKVCVGSLVQFDNTAKNATK
jgi:hypothetical protein